MAPGSSEKHTQSVSGTVDIETKNGMIATGKADAALEFLRTEDIAVITEVDEKALVRKIDWMIMPLMWAAYNLQYLDKVLSRFSSGISQKMCLIILFTVNYASVMGLLSDTNMHTDQFSNLTLAFYVTYLFFELPTGFLMQRLPTAKYLGFNGASLLMI